MTAAHCFETAALQHFVGRQYFFATAARIFLIAAPQHVVL